MKNTILGAGVISVLATIAFSSAADARCSWTGYHWSCEHLRHHHHAYRSYYRPYVFSYSPGQYSASRLGPEPGGGFYHLGKSNIGKTD